MPLPQGHRAKPQSCPVSPFSPIWWPAPPICWNFHTDPECESFPNTGLAHHHLSLRPLCYPPLVSGLLFSLPRVSSPQRERGLVELFLNLSEIRSILCSKPPNSTNIPTMCPRPWPPLVPHHLIHSSCSFCSNHTGPMVSLNSPTFVPAFSLAWKVLPKSTCVAGSYFLKGHLTFPFPASMIQHLYHSMPSSCLVTLHGTTPTWHYFIHWFV